MNPPQLTIGDGNAMLNIDDPRLHDNHLGDGFIVTIPRTTSTTIPSTSTTDSNDDDDNSNDTDYDSFSNSNESQYSSENSSDDSMKTVSRLIRDVETTTRRSSRKSLAKSSTPKRKCFIALVALFVSLS